MRLKLFWHSKMVRDVTGKSKEFCCIVYNQLYFSSIGPGSSFTFYVCIYDRQFIDHLEVLLWLILSHIQYIRVSKTRYEVFMALTKSNGREKLLPTFMNHSHNSVFPIFRYISCKKIRFPISTNGLAI